MNINDLSDLAIKTINAYRKDKIIMDFVIDEALEKTAKDIRKKTGSGTTKTAVKLLVCNGNDKTIIDRFNKYVDIGLLGCYLAATS